METFGEMIPLGGGDTIPLFKKCLLVGRRESCDIVLRFSNVSAHHCQLTLNGGYWYVKDLESRNGTRVNGMPITFKRIDPQDSVTIARHRYQLQYSPIDLGAVGPPPPEETPTDIMATSLLERAGLKTDGPKPVKSKKHLANDGPRTRYDIITDEGGDLKDLNEPV